MEIYEMYAYSVFYLEDLNKLINIAESEPDSLLGYDSLEGDQDGRVLDQYMRFSILIPKSKIDRWRDDLEDMDWTDTDAYELEPEPWRFILKRKILEDLHRLVEISNEINDVRSNYIGTKAYDEAKKEASEDANRWPIANGPHWFSGIQEFHIDEDEDTFSQLDGYAIEIDGNIYLAVEDPSDGYRSYAYLRDVVPSTIGIEINNHFEPQKVYAETKHETIVEDGWTSRDAEVFRLKNQYGQTVLEISTDYAEDYYPVGSVRYLPENLPCNAKPLPN